LLLDRTKLRDAISKDAAAVTKLFGEGGQGLADNLGGLIQGFIGPIGSLPKKMASITQAISALNMEKGRLEQAQSSRANSAVEKYAQQQGTASNWSGTSNPLAQLKGSSLRFDFPA
jgi:flagellar hook-associated protein 2